MTRMQLAETVMLDGGAAVARAPTPMVPLQVFLLLGLVEREPMRPSSLPIDSLE